MDTRHPVITILSDLLFYCTTDVNRHGREITSHFRAFLTLNSEELDISNLSIPSLKDLSLVVVHRYVVDSHGSPL